MKLFIDVRESVEFEQNHVKGALNIPLSELMTDKSKLDLLPKQAELVVYCLSGNRSKIAIKILKNKGFNNLINGISQQHVEASIK